jgi:peroxiredoxin
MMNRNRTVLGTLVLAMVGIGSAYAFAIGSQVKDFQLPDTAGKVHQLYKMTDRKAIVLMTQGNGCPIVRLAMPLLREIRDTYRDRGVEVLLINPNLQDTPQAVADESKEFGFDLTILMDKTQKISEGLGVNRTAEIFVIDPKTWKLVFHGPIDDRLSYEKQRPVKHHYLADALDAVLAGKPVPVAEVNAPGCIINFPNRR